MPVWASYDALVLISHIPMINISMPSKTSIALTELSKTLRLDFIPLSDWVKDWTSSSIGYADKPLTIMLERDGYDATSILLNLAPFVFLFLLFVLAQLVAKCADCTYVRIVLKKPQPNGRSLSRSMTMTQKTLNGLVRLLVVTQTEFFICLFINFKAVSGPVSFPIY